ncbi:aminoacyl-tRNA hydrolase [Corynebacterium bovis]|uniref:Peptidyl-tRNA hydrolase n=2 Tax=Corynebacterium bovis TaxID=36808 RepID=A0A3R8PJX2_9CORY|nr:aminoacyl-tRNA hydrolase [Corynebacterium bovis]MBB3115778.1 PTH1 family peptidyl-tRNA hydrolase [Corynebacterium bovis DSM 20582 = CIP 54.80]MDK8510497.1 aminoacyl-tRNA hydrolase [Corynebacterium bovis]QQC47451.1 aminoacyl-tRNA hydrolase [Corynebacterium bovis]RRO81636.1 aminoacyl-tRNA hydrolase [Corynebacterium bovis]RRO83707.1 aminoacyl-tRNA hydrolase [Corynebacterium bovis]
MAQSAPGGDRPWLIVGLGNPGEKYAATRHNVGYMVVDEILGDILPVPGSLKQHKRTNSLICETRVTASASGRAAGSAASAGDGVPVVLARSRGYMNLSGGAVGALASFFRVPPAQVVVVHDELDLDPGVVRVKLGGGENGHNGLKSTTQALGTRDYVRVRVGIGRPPGRMDPAAYVLKPFTRAELDDLPVTVADAADAVRLVVTRGVEAAQNEIHARH